MVGLSAYALNSLPDAIIAGLLSACLLYSYASSLVAPCFGVVEDAQRRKQRVNQQTSRATLNGLLYFVQGGIPGSVKSVWPEQDLNDSFWFVVLTAVRGLDVAEKAIDCLRR